MINKVLYVNDVMEQEFCYMPYVQIPVHTNLMPTIISFKAHIKICDCSVHILLLFKIMHKRAKNAMFLYAYSHLVRIFSLYDKKVTKVALYFNFRCFKGKSQQINSEMLLPKYFCWASFSCLPENITCNIWKFYFNLMIHAS